MEIPKEYWPYFVAFGRAFGHDPLFLAALCYGESKFSPGAVSEKGARGLMQFMPGAWSRFGFGPYDNAFDPREAILAAARYLEYIRKYIAAAGYFGPVWEIIAYWGGEGYPGAVSGWLDVPERTRLWVADILHQWSEWLANPGSWASEIVKETTNDSREALQDNTGPENQRFPD